MHNGVSKEFLEKCRRILIRKAMKIEYIVNEEERDKFISEFIKTDKLDDLYHMLEDAKSKSILKKVVIHRYMLFFNSSIDKSPLKKLIFSFKYQVHNTYHWFFMRSVFKLFFKYFYPREIDEHINFYTFFMKQYNVKNIYEVCNGSIIFDIGAFKGDTALFFSKKCGSSGHVYAIEPDKDIYNILAQFCKKYNLDNVGIYDNLFLDEAGVVNFYSGYNDNVIEKEGITLYEFISDNKIEKIDFMKMDIEGGELTTLKGAKDTIMKLRPNLAIAIYHGGDIFFEDFITIPSFIKEITPNYKYYIRSFSPWGIETILYCIAN